MTADAPSPGKTPRKFNLGRFLINAGLIAAVVGGGIWLWKERIEDQVIVKRFGVVSEGHVYRSGRLTENTLRKVQRERGIRTIVDLGADPEGSEADTREQQVCDELGVERHVYRLIGDGTGNPNAYVAALRVLADPANHPVLFHCGAGSQRAGATTILYRHIIEGKPISEVYPEAFRYDHEPEDWKLLAYLADHADEIAAAFRGGGWVEGYPPMLEPSTLTEKSDGPPPSASH